MTKTSLCPAVDDQGRKCRKLLPHFDYEHIFMDDQSKGPIPPALSPEEWESRSKSIVVEARPQTVPVVHYVQIDTMHSSTPRLHVSAHYSNATPVPDLNHAIAALALHMSPFGFTREDVEWLEWVGRKVLGSDESLAQCESLVARIEALLPPSDEKPPATP